MVDDELLDIVDKNDTVIGTVYRSKSSGLQEGYLRASELFIVNDKGRLWVPTRQPHKKIAPNGLDYSAAGHVASGDGYEETLLRETVEELNLKIDKEKLKFLHKFSPKPNLPPYFRAVYLYKSNAEPKYNKDDFSGFQWLTPEELKEKIVAGVPAKESLLETVDYLIEHKSLLTIQQ